MAEYTLHLGDCLDVMRTLPDNSVDSVVTDPPYGIRFMGKAWDGKDIEERTAYRAGMPSQAAAAGVTGGHSSRAAEAGKYDLTPGGMKAFQAFTFEWATECLRVLKPGGHLLSFASPRTYHHLAVGIEMAGFEIRDQIMWVFGSGFPKSHNLKGDYEGWGTALKPAHEPICMARKPFRDTVAENMAEHGVGALHIDACRIGVEETSRTQRGTTNSWEGGSFSGEVATGSSSGRWPANLIHSGCADVVAIFPTEAGASAPVLGTESSMASIGNITGERDRVQGAFHNDSGSAARFFYCAKTSRTDRHEGMLNPGPQFKQGTTLRDVQTAELKGNTHPTVKPTDLMAYLLRLVTPPGGLTLDPFVGSGSTGKAAMLEGFDFIGCDNDKSYLAIAEARILYAQQFAKDESSQTSLF